MECRCGGFQNVQGGIRRYYVPQRFVVPNIPPWQELAWGLKLGKVVQLAENSIFTSNFFELYSNPAYPLGVGAVAPTPDAQWSRHQFSSIWAPQPKVYNLSISSDRENLDTSIQPSDTPIPEGEEADGFFTPSGSAGSKANRHKAAVAYK